MATSDQPRLAVVTGGSRGLGRAVTRELALRGWRVIADARDADRLRSAVRTMPPGSVTPVAGDIADAAHRLTIAEAVEEAGGLDLLVNNASILGPSPQPRLADYPLDVLGQVYAVNTLAPLGLLQLLLPYLGKRGGRIVSISSDAAVEPYEGWGGYGSAKAALDHLMAVLAAEQPGLRIYSFDPGDMATDLQQQAFPDEDVTDRAAPETVVPALMRLVDGDLPSGRYRAVDLAVNA
jgi:NAD(P)-dependent dehydrogenase (short-subunit alcohol dehydrogenase family)